MSTFYQHPEGKTIVPYEFPVHIPPVGYVWDYFKGEWAPREIYSRSEVKEEQYWDRSHVDKFDYEKKRIAEKRKQDKNRYYTDPEVTEFVDREWDRRINGFWFMNNGEATYITGCNYMYLTWWRIDVGYPAYRESDRNFFYMWSYVEEDPKCFGLMEAARRRSGKALPLDTPIPTTDGFKNMEDLQVGDYVFGAEGEPVKVSYKSPIHYNHKCYRITFNDGSSIVADEEHQWEVTTSYSRETKSVLNTKQLIEGGTVNWSEYNYRVDICKEIDYTYSDKVYSNGYREITSIEEVESVPTQCIEVDSERSVYLAGRDYILTHNTYRATVILYEATSRMIESNAGIQSKTGSDGQKVFSKLINSFRALPDFFRPVFDNTAGERPKKVLSFIRKKADPITGDDSELTGKIDYESSGLLGYDSQKLKRYLRDECFGEGTELRMYNGEVRKVEHIEVGDLMMGDDGSLRTVTSNDFGEDELYEITPNKGQSFTCTEDHTLLLKWARSDYKISHRGKKYAFGEVLEITVNEYINLTPSKQKHLVLFGSNFNKGFSIKSIGKGKYYALKVTGNNRILLGDGTVVHNCGKTEEVDVSLGWDVVRECLRLGVSQIVGKAFYTTTIEEGGSIPFRRLWNGSDFNKKDENTNMTQTGMYRTFTPAYKNVDDHIDIYGKCDEVAAKREMQYQREALLSQPKLRAGYIRKYPFTIEEAFFSINDECIFDSLKINEQAKILSFKDDDHWFIRGNFTWSKGFGSKVQFHKNNNGRWLINKLYLDADKKHNLSNAWKTVGDRYYPKSESTTITGADTFDHKRKNLSDERQASNAAFYTYMRSHPQAPEIDDTFICEYIHRQPTADLMAEDLAMQSFFFGSPTIIENNKPAAISYFERMGLKPFIIKVDKRDGISGTVKNKQSMAEETEAYIRNNIEKVVFQNLLLDWNEFSLEDSTKYDATMGAGWALLIANRIGKKFQKTPDHIDRMRRSFGEGGIDYSNYF